MGDGAGALNSPSLAGSVHDQLRPPTLLFQTNADLMASIYAMRHHDWLINCEQDNIVRPWPGCGILNKGVRVSHSAIPQPTPTKMKITIYPPKGIHRHQNVYRRCHTRPSHNACRKPLRVFKIRNITRAIGLFGCTVVHWVVVLLIIGHNVQVSLS